MKTRVLVCCLLVALAACSKQAPPEPPIATAKVTLSHARVPLGSPVEMTYRFVPASNARIDGDYYVFVHFLEAGSREMMWTDDHLPPVPTSQWKPGQPVEYTRTMFAPVYPYVGSATVEMGLYHRKTSKRLTLAAGTDRGHQSYEVSKLELLPQTENIFLMYKDGWYATEVAQGNPMVEWQWTKGQATLAFRNPKRNVLFYLQVGTPPNGLTDRQTVTVRIADQAVDTFPVNGEVLRKVPLTAAQLGTDEMTQVKIDVDKTFVPALWPAMNNRDNRELGICVLHVFVEPK